MNDGSDSSAAAILFVCCIIALAAVAFWIFIFWRIFKKTGQNGAMSLLQLIPVFGPLIVYCILAFGKWPIETEVEQYRMMHGKVPPSPAASGYQGYPPQQSQSQQSTPHQYPPQYP